MFRNGIGFRVAMASLIGWLDERLQHWVPDVAAHQRLSADSPAQACPAARGHTWPASPGHAGVRVCGPCSRRRVIAHPHPHPQLNLTDLRLQVGGPPILTQLTTTLSHADDTHGDDTLNGMARALRRLASQDGHLGAVWDAPPARSGATR